MSPGIAIELAAAIEPVAPTEPGTAGLEGAREPEIAAPPDGATEFTLAEDPTAVSVFALASTTTQKRPEPRYLTVREKAEPEPLAPPESGWFIRGVLTFPWWPGALAHWTILCLLFVPALCMTAASVWLSHYGLLVSIPALACVWLWVWALSYAAACFVAIVQDTGSGSDDVQSWPEGDWRDRFVTMLHLSVQLGLSLVAATALAWPVSLFVELPWGVGAAALAANFICPLFLLSSMEAGTLLSPYSPVVLGSLLKTPAGWLVIYVESLLLLAAAFGLLAAGFEWIPMLTVVLAAPLLATVIFLEARLYGRLAWHIGRLQDWPKVRLRKRKAPAAGIDPAHSRSDPAILSAKFDQGATADTDAAAGDQEPSSGCETRQHAVGASTASAGVIPQKKKKKKKKTGWAALNSTTRKLVVGFAGAGLVLLSVLGVCLLLPGKPVTVDDVAGEYVSDRNPEQHQIAVSADGTCRLSSDGGQFHHYHYDYMLTLDGGSLELKIPGEALPRSFLTHGTRVRSRIRLMKDLFGDLTFRGDYIQSSQLGRFSRVKVFAASVSNNKSASATSIEEGGYVDMQVGKIPLSGMMPQGWKSRGGGGGRNGPPIFAKISDGGSNSIEILESLLLQLAQAPSGRGAAFRLSDVHEYFHEVTKRSFWFYEEQSPREIQTSGFGKTYISDFSGRDEMFGEKVKGCRATLLDQHHQYNVICKCTAAEFEAVKPVFEKIIASLGKR